MTQTMRDVVEDFMYWGMSREDAEFLKKHVRIDTGTCNAHLVYEGKKTGEDWERFVRLRSFLFGEMVGTARVLGKFERLA